MARPAGSRYVIDDNVNDNDNDNVNYNFNLNKNQYFLRSLPMAFSRLSVGSMIL